MAEWRPILALSALASVLAGGVSLSSRLQEQPEPAKPEGAIAAALVADADEVLQMLPLVDEEGGRTITKVSTCVKAAFPLDFTALNEALNSKKLRAYPKERCSFERDYGPHGMFVYIDYYSDPAGEAAMAVDVMYSCESKTRCTVQVDYHGGGRSYEVARTPRGWVVERSQMEWVV